MLLCCEHNKDKTHSTTVQSVHPQIDSFNALTREQQVNTCGNCHNNVYENEMKGPHANALKRLHEHAMADWSQHPEYNNYLQTVYVNDSSSMCRSCHALPNLYETFLKEPNKNDDSLKKFVAKFHVPEKARHGKVNDLLTGVDCLTCHYNGTNVITNFDFQQTDSADCPLYCRPVGSKLFSSNNNCITCHKEEVVAMVNLPGVKNPETSCIKCHQEYDDLGKSTHYTYWQMDGPDKPKPSRLIVFDDISAKYIAEKNEVLIEWKNTRLPHPLTLCTETIAFFEVVNNSGKTLGKGEIRLNRREQHHSVLQPFWGNKPVPGINGHDIPLDGKILSHTISNINAHPNTQLKLIITGGHKGQYWLPDSLQVVSYRKVLAL